MSEGSLQERSFLTRGGEVHLEIELLDSLSDSELRLFFNLPDRCHTEEGRTTLDRKYFSEQEDWEDFLEILSSKGIVVRSGKSDRGIAGWVWIVDMDRYNRIRRDLVVSGKVENKVNVFSQEREAAITSYVREYLSPEEMSFFVDLPNVSEERDKQFVLSFSEENEEPTLSQNQFDHLMEILATCGMVSSASTSEGSLKNNFVCEKEKYFNIWKNLSGVAEEKNITGFENDPGVWFFILQMFYKAFIGRDGYNYIVQDHFYSSMKYHLKKNFGWKITNEIAIQNVTQFLLLEGLIDVGDSKYFPGYVMTQKGFDFIGMPAPKVEEEEGTVEEVEVMEATVVSKSKGPKSQEELKAQFERVQGVIGREPTHTLLPASEKEDIFSLNEEQLKQKYPRRYAMYVKLFRREKTPEPTDRKGVMSAARDLENMRRWFAVLNSLDLYIQNHHEGETKTLYERQMTVFEKLHEFLENGGREGYVKLPTGVGKTVLFTEFVEAMDIPTIIIVPTKILIHQTEDKMATFAPELDVGKVYTAAKEFGRQVTITTYSSFAKGLKKGIFRPKDYNCLILDEAHVSLSEKRVEAVRQFTESINIGFTATPDYSPEKRLGNLLETEIDRMEIPEAVQEKLLSPFKIFVAKTDVDLSRVKVTSIGEYDEKDLELVLNVESRNKAAVEIYKQMFDGQRGVCYCLGVTHAKQMAQLFREAGVSAVAIHGKTPDDEQEKILKDFKSGKIKMICNANLLIFGFDEPKARLCLNLRPTLSRVVAEQRGGRVLRLDLEDDTKRGYIVDFQDDAKGGKNSPVLFSQITKGFGIEAGSGDVKDVAGVKVVSHIDDIEAGRAPKKVRERKVREKNPPPEGWVIARTLARDFNVSERAILTFSRTFLFELPDKIGLFDNPYGGQDITVHPDLEVLIRAYLTRLKNYAQKLPRPRFQSFTSMKFNLNQNLEDQIYRLTRLRFKLLKAVSEKEKKRLEALINEIQ